ncbi:serine hydrolase [Mucilaginibacter calamicampi]|uniref:Serine hydrolase n=1 Tax=Mucilaginibacter calamicampi TaxID=1302352 RepID=A0ABW2YZB8_9SPHI
MKAFLALSVLLLFFSQTSTPAQNQKIAEKIKLVEKSLVGPVHKQGDKGWTIRERMAHYKVNGVSIAVIHNYKIEWAKGYGWADKSSKTPVSPSTLFQAGSISKSLNAVGVLKLAQQGKIDLHTDINQYLRSWKFPYNAVSKNKKITLAHLLTHTAGLGISGFNGYAAGQPIPSLPQVLNGQRPANSAPVRSVFEPGLRHEYSGGGTTITQMIVTDITYQRYSDYMHENVLKPLGMTSSTFTQPIVKNAATGYYENGKQVEGKYHIYPEQAAAGLWTTPTDLARFIIDVQQAYAGQRNTLLTPATAKLMLTPYLDAKAAPGVYIDNYNGEKYFEHTGLTHGFYSHYYGSLSGGNGLVIMTNSVNTDLVAEMVNSIAHVYGFRGLYRSQIEKDFKVSDEVLQTYIGRYKLGPDAILNVSKKGQQLFIQLNNEEKTPVFAETMNKFYLKAVDAQIEFVKNSNGKITKAILYQDGSANPAPRLGNK